MVTLDICELVMFPPIERSIIEPLTVVAGTFVGTGVGKGIAVIVGIGEDEDIGVAVGGGVDVGTGVGGG
jgi:hypothetical protein